MYDGIYRLTPRGTHGAPGHGGQGYGNASGELMRRATELQALQLRLWMDLHRAGLDMWLGGVGGHGGYGAPEAASEGPPVERKIVVHVGAAEAHRHFVIANDHGDELSFSIKVVSAAGYHDPKGVEVQLVPKKKSGKIAAWGDEVIEVGIRARVTGAKGSHVCHKCIEVSVDGAVALKIPVVVHVDAGDAAHDKA